MYGIFVYIYHKDQPHGRSGFCTGFDLFAAASRDRRGISETPILLEGTVARLSLESGCCANRKHKVQKERKQQDDGNPQPSFLGG